MPSLPLSQLADLTEGSLLFGDPARPITALGGLAEATASMLSFCSDAHHLPAMADSAAGAVLVPRKLKLTPEIEARLTDRGTALLAVDDVDLAMNTLLETFAPPIARPPVGIDPLARVDATATIGVDAKIGPFVTIGARATLGQRCILHPGVVIGDDTRLGDDCELFPNVVVRERCTLGDRVIMHAGSVVGSDGFGYRWDGRKHAKVPQIGTVVIGSDVEIGSCACVDRAKFSETVVGPGTKIDNLVQVGHNTRIGAHCIIVGQVGLAGSVTLGNGVVLGGQSAIRDHIKLGDGSMVAACSAVADDVAAKSIVSGLPALPHRQSLREQAALRRLPELVSQMRKLQEEVNRLKAAMIEEA